jgi:hypothetical protein
MRRAPGGPCAASAGWAVRRVRRVRRAPCAVRRAPCAVRRVRRVRRAPTKRPFGPFGPFGQRFVPFGRRERRGRRVYRGRGKRTGIMHLISLAVLKGNGGGTCLLVAALSLLAGCGADDAGAPERSSMPFGPGAQVFDWSTEQFSLGAGQERYLCYARTLQEDLVINGYNSVGDKFVHHLILSRASAPEPEGFSECDVAFRNSWETLFITGTGASTLEFPGDAGHTLKKGTQLIVQMHLLNAAEAPVEGSLTVHMRRSEVANPRPVSNFIFGTAAVELPPHAKTEVVGTCAAFQPVTLIAGFPHMHMLGSSMRFEVGKSEATMQQVFSRDPFDFNSQRIDKLDVTVSQGDLTRVRCMFDNIHEQTIGYGESTKNEMCYFVGFAVDQPRISGCLEVLPPGITPP